MIISLFDRIVKREAITVQAAGSSDIHVWLNGSWGNFMRIWCPKLCCLALAFLLLSPLSLAEEPGEDPVSHAPKMHKAEKVQGMSKKNDQCLAYAVQYRPSTEKDCDELSAASMATGLVDPFGWFDWYVCSCIVSVMSNRADECMKEAESPIPLEPSGVSLHKPCSQQEFDRLNGKVVSMCSQALMSSVTPGDKIVQIIGGGTGWKSWVGGVGIELLISLGIEKCAEPESPHKLD